MTSLFKNRYYKYFAQVVLCTGLMLNTSHKVNLPPINSPSHIVFIENSLDEALKQAKAQNKYIFVDAYATWCGPCKDLKAKTFTNEKAAAFYNANFINVAIDVEKGQGPTLASRWQLQSVPTLIILNSSGKPILGTVGFVSANDLIRFGKQALNKQ